MIAENVKKISDIVRNAVVQVEEYFKLGEENYCFFNYHFELETEINFVLKIVYFKLNRQNNQWEMHSLTFNKLKRPIIPQGNPDNIILNDWLSDQNPPTANFQLINFLVNNLNIHLEKLLEYVKGKTDFGKIFWRNSWGSKWGFWPNALFNTIGETGMFVGSTILADMDSNLENNIKNNATRKNDSTENTLNITKAILENMSLPGDKTTIQNIELNNAFRISFK
jgi:hypothetical protein